MLRANPSLVRARSARDHRATLLHYTAANGHEGYRQKTPKNAVDVARVLLEAGPEPDALAHMYGGEVDDNGHARLERASAIAGLQVALVDIARGPRCRPSSGVDDNGSPLMTAFRFHYPHAADALVRRGARMDNVISAAALGRTDLLDDWVVDGTTARSSRRNAGERSVAAASRATRKFTSATRSRGPRRGARRASVKLLLRERRRSDREG